MRPMNESGQAVPASQPLRSDGLRDRLVGWMLLALSAALAVRLLLLVHRHAVNILFLDQWNFCDALAGRADWLAMFRWQHGPHRQGCGLFLSYWIAAASGWNTRAESFAIAFLIFLALGLAFVLKRTLSGRWQTADVVLPLLFLSPVLYETLIGTPNPSHGALPLLLLMAYGLAWCAPRRGMSYGLILVLNLLLTYTGFGVFVGLLTPVILAACCWRAGRAGDRLGVAWSLAALAIALLTAASFLVGYDLEQATVPALQKRQASWWEYPQFMALLFGKFFGVQDSPWSLVCGGGAVLIVAAVCTIHTRRWWKNENSPSLVVAVFTVFSLIFALGTASGRVRLGDPGGGVASRYMIYLIPGLLGVYLHCLSLLRQAFRRLALIGVVVAVGYGALPLHQEDAVVMRYFSQGKRAWKAAYLATSSVEEADRLSHFQVYPDPATYSVFRQDLEYLRERKANLFKPRD
jgi:hypothetical protein